MSRSPISTRLLASGAVLLGVLSNVVAADLGTGATPQVAVFNCGGDYIVVDPSSGATGIQGNIYGESRPARFDGCLVGDVVADPARSRLYAILPVEGTVDENGAEHFRLISADAVSLKILSSFEIAGPLTVEPRLLVDSDGNTLVLLYGDSEDRFNMDVDSLTPLRSTSTLGISATSAVPKANCFETNRSLSVDGSPIPDVVPESLLDPSSAARLSSLRRPDARGRLALDITLAQVAAGRAAYVVAWDMRSKRSSASGIVLVDGFTRRLISAFPLPNPVSAFDGTQGSPTVHLAPDGRHLAVEEYVWSQPPIRGNADAQRAKTGSLAIYDGYTGVALRGVTLHDGRRADGRVLGFSRDSRYLFYSANDEFWTVDVDSGHVSHSVMHGGFVPISAVRVR